MQVLPDVALTSAPAQVVAEARAALLARQGVQPKQEPMDPAPTEAAGSG